MFFAARASSTTGRYVFMGVGVPPGQVPGPTQEGIPVLAMEGAGGRRRG